MTDENLWAAFDHFDTEGVGEITPRTIAKTFIWASKAFEEKDVESMIHEVSVKDSISFDEFVLLMKNQD